MAIMIPHRHKHLRLDQSKIDRARKILGASTETEAIEKSLDLVVQEASINSVLRRARGRLTLRKVF